MQYLIGLQDKYINPFTDFGFKKIFGTEPNKDLLIHFLNEVVLPDRRKIQDLQYKSNEQLGNQELDRKAIFDLYCMGTNGERFIVEMQKAQQNFFVERSVYYASFPIQEQGRRGAWDYNLAEVYTVGILDFVFQEDQKEKRVRHEIKLKDQDCQVFYDKLTFIYLEMPNFLKTEEELETTYDKWLYVLKHLPDLERRPQKLQERVFEKLFETAEIAKFNSQEREAYESSLKYYRDLQNVIDTANTEGREKGRQEGLREGRDEGRQEGKLERNREIARKALVENIPINMIVQLTELSEEEILKLKG